MPAKSILLRAGLFAALIGVQVFANARAEEPPTKAEPSKATFLITGFHCPPCASTVARSLQGIKGVKSVKVNYGAQNAKVEFDEQVVSAQKLAGLMGSTPHMMGGGMRYGGWLSLKVEGVQDEANAKKAKEALAAVKGVAKVVVYPKQQSVGVAFDGRGSVTTNELLAALKEAGLKASNYP